MKTYNLPGAIPIGPLIIRKYVALLLLHALLLLALCRDKVSFWLKLRKRPTAMESIASTIKSSGHASGFNLPEDAWDRLSQLIIMAHTEYPGMWNAVTIQKFSSFITPASEGNSDIRAGYVDEDPIASRYIYEYNDITNLHAMRTGEAFAYEQPNNLWISEKMRRFKDAHTQGPYMNAHGCMESVCHLKYPVDVLDHAVSLHYEATSSQMMSVDLFVVDYKDVYQLRCHFPTGYTRKLFAEQHRPFKCLVKVRLYDVWRAVPPPRMQLKRDLRFVMHEAACTPLRILASIFVDIEVDTPHKHIRQLPGIDIHRSWTLPGSFVRGRYVLPLLLQYMFNPTPLRRCELEGWTTLNSTPLVRGLTPWFLRPLMGSLVTELVPFVLPSIRNNAALLGSLKRRSLTPGEDMRIDLLMLSDVRESLGFNLVSTGYMARRGIRSRQPPVSCRRVSWTEVRANTNMMDAAWDDEYDDWYEPEPDSDSDNDGDGFGEVKEGIRAAWSHPHLGQALDVVLREMRGARRYPILIALNSICRQRWYCLEGSDDAKLQQALFRASALLYSVDGLHILAGIMLFL